MSDREFLITATKQERDLMDDLLAHLESKERLHPCDYQHFEIRTHEVLNRLKTLRQHAIKKMVDKVLGSHSLS